MKDDIINLMVADLIAKAADIETRFWNDHHSFVKCFEEKKQLCGEFTKSFVSFIERRISEEKNNSEKMRDSNEFEDFEDVRQFCTEIHNKSENWLKEHEKWKGLVEYDLIEACNALAYDRLYKMKDKR